MRFRDDIGLQLLLGIIALIAVAYSFPFFFSYLLAGAFWLGLLAVCAMIAYVVFWVIRNRLSPVKRARARVIRRRQKNWDVSVVGDTPETAAAKLGMLGRHPERAAKAWGRSLRSPDVPELTLYSGVDLYVTFKTDKRELEFKVPCEAYIACREGTEGLLIFQGEQFKAFLPDARVESGTNSENS